jgi:hypothetical protein
VRRPLTQKQPEDPADLVELCSTLFVGELAFIKSVLHGEGISYSTVGEFLTQQSGPMLVMVRRDDLERARGVLASLEPPTEICPAEPALGRGSELAPGGDQGR